MKTYETVKFKIIFFILIFSVFGCTKNDYSSIELTSMGPTFTQLTETAQGNPGSIDVKVSVGNTHYMTSVMKSIFLNPNSTSAQSNTIKDRISKRITNQILFMGGSCNRYEGNCTKEQATAAFSATTSPIRKGYLVRACEEITSQDEAVVTALSNAGLTISAPGNSNNIKIVYSLFFPGRSVSNEAITNLINLHQAAIDFKQTPADAWRFVLYTLCASPLMEML